MGVTNYLLSGMILQVGTLSSQHQNQRVVAPATGKVPVAGSLDVFIV